MRGSAYRLDGVICNQYRGCGLLVLALTFFGGLGLFVPPLKITKSGPTLYGAEHAAIPRHRFFSLGDGRFRPAHTDTQCIDPGSRFLVLLTYVGQPFSGLLEGCFFGLDVGLQLLPDDCCLLGLLKSALPQFQFSVGSDYSGFQFGELAMAFECGAGA